MLEAILAVIVAVVAAFGLGRWQGGRRARERREADDARAGVEAETQRRRIEDDIDQDIDLAGRARRSGVVRPDR